MGPSTLALLAGRLSRATRLLALAVAIAAIAAMATGPAAAGQAVTLTGAGASFPYPIYSKWMDEYNRLHPEVRINYQSIGSGGGIRQITARTVDFGASDAFLTDEQLKAARGVLLHVPTVVGAVAVAYNVPGVKDRLKLTPDVLADIFLGRITRWNDPRIAAPNAGVRLPSLPIAVVHRSDGSGTTFIFTRYLSEVSPAWAEKAGAGTSVAWPAGVGAPQNDGVAGQIRQIPGAIGYVELAYALQNRMAVAALRNRDGRFVEPSLESTTQAASGVAMPDDYRTLAVNARGPESYPIAAFTWILLYREQSDPVKGKTLVDFLWWAVHDGQKMAPALHYAPLPADVVRRVERTLRSVTYQGKPLLTQ